MTLGRLRQQFQHSVTALVFLGTCPVGAAAQAGHFESPNRFGLPAFYTLHVWAWKENPNGAFVNWHTNVSCQAFSGQ